MTGTVFAFLGGRDRIGTTTTAVSVGVSMAETATRIAVVDAAFDSDGIEAVLDVPGDDGIRSVLRGETTIDKAMITGPHGVDYLPSGSEPPATTDVRTHRLVRAATTLRERYDVVLLDLGHGGGVDVAVGLELADEAILVSGSAEDDLAATAEAATVVRGHGCPIRGTVLSRVPSVQAIDIVSVTERLGTDVLAVVPEDDAVRAAAEAGQSLLRHDPDSDAAMVYWQLASTLTGSGGLTGPVLPASAETGDASAEREARATGTEDGAERVTAGDGDAAAPQLTDDPGDEPGEAPEVDAEDGTASDTKAEPPSAAEGGAAAGTADGADTAERETGEVAVPPSTDADSTDTEHPDESASSTPEDGQSADGVTGGETIAEPDRPPQGALGDSASADGQEAVDGTARKEEPVSGTGRADVSQPSGNAGEQDADDGDHHPTLDKGDESVLDKRDDRRTETDGSSAAAPGSDEQPMTDTEQGASEFNFDDGDTDQTVDLNTERVEDDSPTDSGDGEFELPGFDGGGDGSDGVAEPTEDGSDDIATPTETDIEADSSDRDIAATDRTVESSDSDSIGASTTEHTDDDSTPEETDDDSTPEETDDDSTPEETDDAPISENADEDRMFEDVSPDPESLLDDDDDSDEDDEINALFKETMDKVTGKKDDEE